MLVTCLLNTHLQKEEELLSCWWKEYAECSEGPKEQPSSSKKLDTQPNASSSEGVSSNQLYEEEEERVGVPVKGGLYEVCLLSLGGCMTLLGLYSFFIPSNKLKDILVLFLFRSASSLLFYLSFYCVCILVRLGFCSSSANIS